jgi:polyhydroxybutyrate depolymerase
MHSTILRAGLGLSLLSAVAAAACGGEGPEPGGGGSKAARPAAPPSSDPGASASSSDGSGAPADPAGSAANACSSAPTAKPGSDFDVRVTTGGKQRSARVHVPKSFDGSKPTPLLLNFHGRMSTASQEELISKTTTKSDAAGFVVVYPDGIGQTWNAGLCCGQAQADGIDDVAFTRALLDEIERKICVDAKRVFATGLSNGAFMVQRLACELSDRIAAIGPVAGQLLSSPCAPSRPVPVMHFHGDADPIVSYQGTFGMQGAQASTKAWATRNGCGATPAQTYAKGDATCATYSGCTSGADVTLCTIAGGGHTWPGGMPIPGLGKTSQDIDATDAMWDFFSKHPMP